MADTTIQVRTLHNSPTAIGWAGSRTLTIDRALAAGGMGLGYNGGELLLLALGACYTNDIFREAEKRKLHVSTVVLEAEADWRGDPVRAHNVTYSVRVDAAASELEILELIEHVDRVAEIHNTLRMGAQVTLRETKAGRAAKLSHTHVGRILHYKVKPSLALLFRLRRALHALEAKHYC